jgi:hypothetical protein
VRVDFLEFGRSVSTTVSVVAESADLTLRIHPSVSVRWSVVDEDRRVRLREPAKIGLTEVFTVVVGELEIGLVVHEPRPSLPEGMSVERFIVGHWQLRGSATTPPRLRCELLVDHDDWDSGPGSGEHLDAIEATGPDFVAAIGTPDSEWLKHLASAGYLPVDWQSALPMIGDTSLADPVIYVPAGIEHCLPPLRDGVAAVAVAVAIKRTSDPDDASAWFAVDIAGTGLEMPPQPRS